ncbi:MAG: hypothetical protein SGI72_07225 [Planctomycetota bacterium]|nr:hypothetical protein [Planctomycetota bacterium]
MNRLILTRIALGASIAAGVGVATEASLRSQDWHYARGAPHRVLWSIERDRAMASADDPYTFCPRQLWRPRPNARLLWTKDERFNADGYRGPLLAAERPPKTLRLVTLGGAGTLGVGVAQPDTFAALTARIVSERAMRCESMNLGVENYSLRQSLERYRNVARPYRPHVVVVSVSTRASYSPAPGGVTDDEKIDASRAFGEPHSAYPPCVSEELRVVQGIEWLRDAINGSYWDDRDFEFRLKRLEPTARRLDWPGIRRVPMNDYYGSLSLLLQETRQDGAHLILLVLPAPETSRVPPIQAAYDRTAVEFGEREKLVILDETDPFLIGLESDLQAADIYGADRYPSTCGHTAIAQALAEIIVRGMAVKATQPQVPKAQPR